MNFIASTVQTKAGQWIPFLGIYFQPLTCLETHDNLYTYRAAHDPPHTPRSKNIGDLDFQPSLSWFQLIVNPA